MKIIRSLKIWKLFIVLFLSFSVAHADVDAGYEAANGVPGTCPFGSSTPDAFGGIDGQNRQLQGFYACNCTSYVAYRLRLNDVKLWKNQINANELFVNHNWGNTDIHWSDAWKWGDDTKLQQVGIRKDQYPAVGSVAHWNAAGSGALRYGHVAYVQRLYTSESTGRIVKIDVVEYNWIPPHLYSSRTLSAGSEKYPTSFLHFEEKGRDANATNATCVAGLSVKPYEDTNEGTFCWVHDGSDADCNDADEYYYFDYQNCNRYDVSREGGYTPNQYCSRVGSNHGYTAHIDDWFPEPIDPNHWGEGFAGCDRNGSGGYGGSSNVGNSAVIVPLF
jgi:surface antigen